MDKTAEIKALEWSYDALGLPQSSLDEAELKRGLARYLDTLIRDDFYKLIAILYRIDISEEKAKSALARRTTQTRGEILADLIMERQMEKLESRRRHSSKGNTSH